MRRKNNYDIEKLIGTRRGFLTVLGADPNSSRKIILKCECGHTFIMSVSTYVHGVYQSCGCQRDNYVRYKKPSTGVKGVYYSEELNKYITATYFQRKKIYLGCFDTIEEAKKVYTKAHEALMPLKRNTPSTVFKEVNLSSDDIKELIRQALKQENIEGLKVKLNERVGTIS